MWNILSWTAPSRLWMNKQVVLWKAAATPMVCTQALEAKGKCKIEAATQTYATVTLQNFFRMYHKLAGMTGMAETGSR